MGEHNAIFKMGIYSPNTGEYMSTFIHEKLSLSSPILGEHMSSLNVGICSPHMGEHDATFKIGVCSPDTGEYMPTFYAIFTFHSLHCSCVLSSQHNICLLVRIIQAVAELGQDSKVGI